MQFGSEEMKELLILAYRNPSMYESAMVELHETVKAYTISKIKKGFAAGEIDFGSKPLTTEFIEYQDYDDIISEAFCRVVHSLERFIPNIIKNDYTPAQRQAWLRRIVYITIADHFKKKGADIPSLDVDEMKNRNKQEKYGEDYIFRSVRFEDLLINIVRVACKAPSKPEKIMAYIFNVIIFREISGHRQNGAAQTTSNYMNGKKLHALKDTIVILFERVFDITVTPADIRSLVVSLGDEVSTVKGNEICETTPKMVADWSNRIKTFVYKHKRIILGEEGESDVTNS